MPRKVVYIAGPIKGYEDQNEPAFRAAATLAEGLGLIPVIPHTIPPVPHEGECAALYGEEHEGHDHGCYLRAGIGQLVGCGLVWMLPGWGKSRGARIERALALTVRIPVFYLKDFTPSGEPYKYDLDSAARADSTPIDCV